MFFNLFDMIRINMSITQSMHEFSDFKAAFARNQMRQQRVACNIERHAQKNVPASLVKLTAEFPVIYVKLEQAPIDYKYALARTVGVKEYVS